MRSVDATEMQSNEQSTKRVDPAVRTGVNEGMKKRRRGDESGRQSVH